MQSQSQHSIAARRNTLTRAAHLFWLQVLARTTYQNGIINATKTQPRRAEVISKHICRKVRRADGETDILQIKTSQKKNNQVSILVPISVHTCTQLSFKFKQGGEVSASNASRVSNISNRQQPEQRLEF